MTHQTKFYEWNYIYQIEIKPTNKPQHIYIHFLTGKVNWTEFTQYINIFFNVYNAYIYNSKEVYTTLYTTEYEEEVYNPLEHRGIEVG